MLIGLLSPLISFFSPLHPAYPAPALDVTLPCGRRLRLVCSIHMGTPDMAPLNARLLEKLKRADALIVEADIRGDVSPFGNEAVSQPLRERLNAQTLKQLEKLAADYGLSLSRLDEQPAWQVALVLQAHQAQRLGLRPDFGIDYQLLQAAQQFSVPVMELEGAQSQIAILRQLPQEGLPLLEDTLTHWHTNARLLQLMISWWLETPPQKAEVTLPNTFSSDLYDVLMHQRNQQWRHYLSALPPGRYVVAVGALHLYGEGNLPGLLKPA